MKRVICLVVLGLAALIQPADAAEIKILAPADKSVIRGAAEFRIQPLDTPADQFLSNPYVVFRDATGQQMEEIRAPRDRQTGICTAVVDTTKLKDGVYTASVTYRTLVNGKPNQVREDMTVAVRNGKTFRPAKFTVQLEDKAYKVEEGADVKLKVVDARGKPLEGARVTFKADKGELESEVELTDSDGEVFINIQNETPEPLTLTITVEGLPPVTRVIKFTE